MNKHLAATALLTAAGIWQTGSWAQGQVAVKAPAVVSAPSADALTAGDPGVLNDSNSFPVEHDAAGVSLRIPSNCRQVITTGAGADLGEYGDPIRKWDIKIQRIVHKEPVELGGSFGTDGKPIPGILDKAAQDMRLNLAGVVVRQDLINIADPGVTSHKDSNNVGMVAIRYTSGGSRNLMQEAIIRSTDRVFFTISLVTPIGEGKLDADVATPQEVAAVRAFGRIVDSVHLLDTAALKREQDARLSRTLVLLKQLHSHSRIQGAMIDKQWLRVQHDGRDVGYSFVTEQNADGPLKLDKAGHPLPPASGDGLLVGVRARSILPPEKIGVANEVGRAQGKGRGPVQLDVASWWFLSEDQNREEWSRVTVATNLDEEGKPDKKQKQQQFSEFGSSALESHTQLNKNGMAGTPIDPNQPPVTMLQQRVLDVTSIDPTGASKPSQQPLPPQWYLPQAIGSMLPRLLPLHPDAVNTPRTYMFITYVPEVRQVMYRYVEVGNEGDFDFGGQKIHAVPVTDRLGWHGSITRHYMSPGGQYLGSENKDTHTITRPVAADELLKIWQNANLTQPDAVQRPKIGGAASAVQPASGRQRSQSADVSGPTSPIR